LKVGDPEPSASLPGFREVTVTATAGQATQAMTFYVTADGRRFIQGSVYDITASPFQADLAKIRTDLEPSFGAPGAPVVVAVFSDFQCGFCKEEGKVLRENLAKAYPEQVRVYFKDYPLEAIHPWAKPASIAGRCIFRQKPAAFWDYHDWIFGAQNEITLENLRAKVEEFAKSKSLEPVQLGACIDNKATESEVNRSIAEGRALAVNSTPTMFINGRRVVGQVPWPQLKQVIDHELEYAKNHGGGEKCCEVKLPGVKP
jgi:protein-disulfide isomerase